MKQHRYNTKITWTGNTGQGTKNYTSYSRDHSIAGDQKSQEILASSDPSFRGDPSRYNPEDLFLSSLSGCHMLWFLHLCSESDIVVIDYKDHATGIMEESTNGSGKFVSVTLNPQVIIQDVAQVTIANKLHQKANQMCFIANSCNFKISHNPTCKGQK